MGTLRSGLTFPWFDGWHVTGTIVVDETLYGQRPAGQIKFRFVCDCMCQYWPPPRYSLHFTEKGLWFLRPVDGKTWEPANGCDSGFRSLQQRGDLETYIRVYKH